MRPILTGDRVTLLGLPDWLLHDLPEIEQREMRAFIGASTTVSSIDEFGYFWLGFGTTRDLPGAHDTASYSGHSFCVSSEFIALEE